MTCYRHTPSWVKRNRPASDLCMNLRRRPRRLIIVAKYVPMFTSFLISSANGTRVSVSLYVPFGISRSVVPLSESALWQTDIKSHPTSESVLKGS